MKVLIFLALCLWSLTRANAGFTIQGPTAANNQQRAGWVSPDGSQTVESVLNPSSVIYLAGATSELKTTLANEFDDYQFVYANGGLNGSLAVNNYSAYVRPNGSGGGANVSLTYTPAPGDPSVGQLRWIQLVAVTAFNGAPPNYYIDPPISDDPNNQTLPFYYTNNEESGQKSDGFYNFSDTPYTPKSQLQPNQYQASATFIAETYLTSWSGQGPITVYDGVEWGYNINYTVAASPDLATVLEPLAFHSLVLFALILFSIPRMRRDVLTAN